MPRRVNAGSHGRQEVPMDLGELFPRTFWNLAGEFSLFRQGGYRRATLI
jgi:hypothetical protein